MAIILVGKRDGRVAKFDRSKIVEAIKKCFLAVGKNDPNSASFIAEAVIRELNSRYGDKIVAVENIQDIVEVVLQKFHYFDEAKSYILYRQEHAIQRQFRPVPDDIKDSFDESEQYFTSELQKFQYFDKYSRFDYDKGRRETWKETVDRVVSYLRELSENKLSDEDYALIKSSILNMDVMPSMRLVAMAGPAAKRSNIGIYNCSYLPIDSIDALCEVLLISMNGCGVGYSVESKYVSKLPGIVVNNDPIVSNFIVDDTTDGWVNALRFGLERWFNGDDVSFDYSKIRPAGSPLRVKGGRSSGYKPLEKMLDFIRSIIRNRAGAKLSTLDVHDIVCMIGECTISGGVRRTALISLFDFNDGLMLKCKHGENLNKNPHRWNANNSAVWPDRELTQKEIYDFMYVMYDSQRGEPGICSRRSFRYTLPSRREKNHDFGINPCGEIILRPNQFCNLSSVICRSNDTKKSLLKKVKVATIIGTIQSMATHFPGLREVWRKNCEEERLLGVDLNGQMDCPIIYRSRTVLQRLKKAAVLTNAKYAKKLGINQSAAVTCVKPNGNSSQLVDSSSGLHPRWAPYYIRRVRVSTHSPIYSVLKDHGVPGSPENGQSRENATMWVFEFPVKSPDGAITRRDMYGISQFDYWLRLKKNWCEHNPSCTITYTDNICIDLTLKVFENQDLLGGLSFLPQFDASYDLMPYEEITEDEYYERLAGFPIVKYHKLYRYEQDDNTKVAQELACVSGQCEL